MIKADRKKMMGWVLDALQDLGGSGRPKEVSKLIWDQHEDELRESGDLLYSWQYDARWAAQELRKEGKLKPVHGRRDLPWELA